jgi:hypothetical protein
LPQRDVFISYARADRTPAEAIAEAVSREGHTVWIDHQAIRDGNAFDTQIEAAIAEAKVVIVLWSSSSVKSRWVRAEGVRCLTRRRPLRVQLVVRVWTTTEVQELDAGEAAINV